jgi:hypothetical protein
MSRTFPRSAFASRLCRDLGPYRQPVLANGYVRYVGEPVAAVFVAIPVGVMRSIGVSLMSTSLPDPVETRHGLPGDPEDTHTRYIEAAIAACLSDASICRKANPGAGPGIRLGPE